MCEKLPAYWRGLLYEANENKGDIERAINIMRT